MSPASAQHCSVTSSAISSIAIVTSPPGATPTPARAPGSPSDGATASRTRAARSSASSDRDRRASVIAAGPAPVRRARGSARRGGASRTRSARSSPGGDEAVPQRRRRRAPGAARRASAADVAGRHEQRVHVGAGDVAVALDRGRDDRRARGHRLEQHDAERLAAQRRRAEHGRAAQTLVALGVGDGARATRRSPPRFAAAPQLVGLRPDARRPTARASRSMPRHASSSTSRPLRGSCRPMKNTAGRGRRRRHRPTRTRSISMPFHSTTYSASYQLPARGLARRLRHRRRAT